MSVSQLEFSAEKHDMLPFANQLSAVKFKTCSQHAVRGPRSQSGVHDGFRDRPLFPERATQSHKLFAWPLIRNPTRVLPRDRASAWHTTCCSGPIDPAPPRLGGHGLFGLGRKPRPASVAPGEPEKQQTGVQQQQALPQSQSQQREQHPQQQQQQREQQHREQMQQRGPSYTEQSPLPEPDPDDEPEMYQLPSASEPYPEPYPEPGELPASMRTCKAVPAQSSMETPGRLQLVCVPRIFRPSGCLLQGPHRTTESPPQVSSRPTTAACSAVTMGTPPL